MAVSNTIFNNSNKKLISLSWKANIIRILKDDELLKFFINFGNKTRR